MRLFRLIVVLATLVSLPGYGLAATGHAGGCPERASGDTAGAAHTAAHAMDMAGMDMAAMDMSGMDMGSMDGAATATHGPASHHGCCPGTADPKPTSTPHEGCPACVAGHACKGTPAAQAPAVRVLRLLPRPAALIDEPSPHASQCGPDGLLRPPNRS
jgi:uncharacterized protein involved in copper resistance